MLFLGYYLNITLFYHSHIINGIEVTHSHFYWKHSESQNNPIKHSHTKDQLFTIQIISHVLLTTIAGCLFLEAIQIAFRKLVIYIKEYLRETYTSYGYSLRGPPSYILPNRDY